MFIPFTVGGGVRTVEDVRRMLRAGADKVSLNTAAVERSRDRRARAPTSSARSASSSRSTPVAATPTTRRGLGGRRPTAGARPTGLDAVEWAVHACDLGAGEILLTSMDRDGTKAGYDLELLRAVGDAVNVPVIASGGVGTLEHLYEGVAAGGASGRARGVDLPLRPAHRPRGEGTTWPTAGLARPASRSRRS